MVNFVSAHGTYKLHTSILVLLILLKAFFLPRYLISQNKAVEARSSLQWLRGAQYDISMELSDMEQMALIQKKSKLKFKDLFGVANVRPFIISAGLMLFQQVLPKLQLLLNRLS